MYEEDRISNNKIISSEVFLLYFYYFTYTFVVLYVNRGNNNLFLNEGYLTKKKN
jgi:hypothetical protein